MKASALFSTQDRERISEAVAGAEQKTSGEIIPVVATASGRYDRAEDIFGVLFALIALSIVWLLFQGASEPADGWSAGADLRLGLPIVLLTLVAGFAVGVALASRLTALRLPFILKSEMRDEVERAASEAFHRFRLRETAGATGILIYVSLYEHQVRVLGDSAISEKLDARDWQAICDAVTDGIREGKAADGLVHAIGLAGELLSRHFPREADDRNELLNELKLID